MNARMICTALAVLAGGCASISIEKPKDGAVGVKMPQPILVTEKGLVSFDDPYLDGNNLSRYNGQNWQYVPQSTLFYAPVGAHVLQVRATDTKLHTDLSQASTFTVSACPLCYTCPAGFLHPITGQCCDSGMCDSSVFQNFGPPLFSNQKCQEATFPGSNKQWLDFDCISTATALVRGGATPSVLAVSFTPTQNGRLRHIQAPIGLQSGTNSLQVWITADSGNAPGQVLEALTVNGVRPQPGPTTVDAPAHVFAAGATQLTAGTRYWLVLGPGAADTVVAWNLSRDDFSIPAATTYLLNTTNSGVGGPWAAKSNLVEPRPAFEIDVR
jgi:hypothetical protein